MTPKDFYLGTERLKLSLIKRQKTESKAGFRAGELFGAYYVKFKMSIRHPSRDIFVHTWIYKYVVQESGLGWR